MKTAKPTEERREEEGRGVEGRREEGQADRQNSTNNWELQSPCRQDLNVVSGLSGAFTSLKPASLPFRNESFQGQRKELLQS